ncbi:MAG: metallophosphoesterase family protein [Gemmatimonadales bacterium]
MTPRATLVFLPGLLVACNGRPAPSLLPAVLDAEVVATLLLVGDTGAPWPDPDPTFGALADMAGRNPQRTAIVFLGDNIYPRGLPPEGAPDRAHAEEVLRAQVDIAREKGVRAWFVLGNHDWDYHSPEGLESARRQAVWVRERGEGLAEVVPEGGCPGPEVRDMGEAWRLIFLDTQWWLHQGPKPVQGDTTCVVADSAGIVEALRTAIAEAGPRRVVVAAHHPLASGGRHGGHFGFRHHLFPLRELESWAWLPLPIVGSIYPLGRQRGASDQDFSGIRNRAMRGALNQVFADQPPLVFAAGHEHALQVIQGRNLPVHLVSGSGSTDHGSWVDWLDSTRYATSKTGWMRLDLLNNGRVRASVITLDEDNKPSETWADWLGQ